MMKGAFFGSMGGARRLAGAIAFGLLASVAAAAVRFSFDPAVEVAGERLEKRGTAHFTYWWFQLYDGALYLPPAAAPDAVLDAVPKRLELAYFRTIPADKLVKAGDQILRRNVSAEEWERLAPGLAQINAAYATVRENDRYTLTYDPGRGTTLALNGRALVTVPGEEFGRLYFRIWFGEEPVDADLRDALLGG